LYNVHLGAIADAQVVITDKNFRVISAGIPFHYSESINYVSKDYTSSLGDNVNFSFKFFDKIYQYVDTITVREKYRLDFSGKALPSRYLDMNMNDVFSTLKNNDYYYFMGEYIENDTHECFLIKNDSKESSITLVFRDKKSGKLKGGRNFLLDNQTLIFSAPFTSYRDEFISAFDPYGIHGALSKMKKEDNQKDLYELLYAIFGNLKDDDNPVLIKYRLKKFSYDK
jgi:hypothetical protein